MHANYHTHTPRCNHASGTEREYIEKAIEAGITLLGFSDHTPYLFPGDYYSTFRMYPQELPGYVSTLRKLKAEYQDQLDLRIGVEAEYYPEYFPQTLDLLRENGIEYMILGQHVIGDEPEGPFSSRPTTDISDLEHYCRQVIAGMDTGLFTYLAHPDLIHFVGAPHAFRQWIGVLIREARDHGVPLEYNLLGLREQRNYPGALFLELVAQENLPLVLGVDAHLPEHLTNTEQLVQARAILDRFGIAIQPTVDIVHI